MAGDSGIATAGAMKAPAGICSGEPIMAGRGAGGGLPNSMEATPIEARLLAACRGGGGSGVGVGGRAGDARGWCTRWGERRPGLHAAGSDAACAPLTAASPPAPPPPPPSVPTCSELMPCALVCASISAFIARSCARRSVRRCRAFSRTDPSEFSLGAVFWRARSARALESGDSGGPPGAAPAAGGWTGAADTRP